MPDLKVTQVRSSIGAKPKTRGTLRALGLRRLGQSNVVPDRPEIRGMLARVPHLVEIEEVSEGENPTAPTGQGPRLGEEAGSRGPAGKGEE